MSMVINQSRRGMGLATIGVLSPFPLNPPSPLWRGRGTWVCRAAPCTACLSNGILLRTGKVQGEALLSVGEAHNKPFPVPACGEGD